MNNFERHWKENRASEIPASKRNVARLFLQPLFDYLDSHKPAIVLDAGCGDGVHIDAILNKSKLPEGSLVIGIDLVKSALDSSRQRGRTDCAFVQGDICKLPFRDGQFDIIYSFGVLAYTDTPFNSFSELCRVTRSGGYIGIWIYPKRGGLSGFLFSLVRRVCRASGPIGCRLIADCIVPFLSLLPTRSKITLANANWRQCREVVLVNIAPDQLQFPDLAEVENWFNSNDTVIFSRDDSEPITLWGKKC